MRTSKALPVLMWVLIACVLVATFVVGVLVTRLMNAQEPVQQALVSEVSSPVGDAGHVVTAGPAAAGWPGQEPSAGVSEDVLAAQASEIAAVTGHAQDYGVMGDPRMDKSDPSIVAINAMSVLFTFNPVLDSDGPRDAGRRAASFFEPGTLRDSLERPEEVIGRPVMLSALWRGWAESGDYVHAASGLVDLSVPVVVQGDTAVVPVQVTQYVQHDTQRFPGIEPFRVLPSFTVDVTVRNQGDGTWLISAYTITAGAPTM